ncbi:MAG: glycosyltransferase family 2 protein, partial [Candidatus Binatia bacterium]
MTERDGTSQEALRQGNAAPEMSVIVITPDNYETIRKIIKRLRAQNVKSRLEVVLVAPSADGLGVDAAELNGFSQVRMVEVGAMTSTARARAAGVRQASAPVVAFVEDHAYPANGWAEALIAAHQQPWAAVGPVMANANPHSLISWANFLIEYGQWLDPAPAGTAEHLPGHNGSYKRVMLLDYGPELEAILAAESVLQWDLRAKGYQLYLEPAAKTYHQNFSSAFSWIPLRFHGGRLFAASRARGWSPLRRLFYAGGAPLIPLVRLWRIVRELRRPGRQHHLLPRVLPALVAGLAVDGV